MGILSVLAGRMLDDDGQPLIAAFRSAAVIDRQIDELIGITKGIVADGHVNRDEAGFLLKWMEANRAASALWPASVLYPRIFAALADGEIDAEEDADILEAIMQCVGSNASARGQASGSTTLPLTRPEPVIEFVDRSFCFTGKFCCGTRNSCEEKVVARGARIGAITKDLSYLVIGEIGSRDWIHSTHGRKIEKAVSYNDRGCTIGIVAEQHWHGSLK